MGNKNSQKETPEKIEEVEDKETESENEKKKDEIPDNMPQFFVESDGTTPMNMLLGAVPNHRNKIVPPTEYIEPSDDFDINDDNRENRRLLGAIYDQRPGVLSVNGWVRRCNFCRINEGKTYWHCFKCDDYDICEACYEQGKGVHLHDGNINYFHKCVESPQYSRYRVAKKENSVEAMLECFSIYKDRYFIGTRRSVNDHMNWLTFGQIHRKMISFIRGCRVHTNNNEFFKKGEYFGILSKTCVEWMVSDLSCFYCGMVSVPIHITMSFEEKKYILQLTKIKYLLVSKEYVQEALKLRSEMNNDMFIISVDSDNSNNNILLFSEMEKLGYKEEEDVLDIESLEIKPHLDLKEEDIVSVVFTSGTTSKPKGVVLTEKTWRNRHSRMKVFPLVEVMFGHPSHMSPRLLFLACLVNGGRFSVLTNNDMNNLFSDLNYTSPTYLSVPPRIMNYIYTLFKNEVKKKIMKLRSKEEEEIKKIKDETFLEFRSRKEEFFGKSLVIISTGGAPTSTKVKRFIRMMTDLPVYEGYGISEVGSVMYNGGKRKEMKLVSCPSLGYFTTDLPFPRGEIAIKDDGMINPYFTDYLDKKGNEESVSVKNRRINPDDGFYYTGDIAEDRNGTFVIIDRKSNIIKLSNGEFFSIEKIENLIKEKCDDLVEDVMIFPNKLKTKLFAIIKLLEEEKEEESPKSKNQEEGDHTSEKVRNIIMNRLKSIDGVKKWQIPSQVLLIHEKFTIENKMLTISNKKNRRKILEHFDPQIKEKFYSDDNNLEDVKEWIHSIIGGKSSEKEGKEVKNFEEFGLDSLSAIRLMNEVERTFHKKIGFQELMNSSMDRFISSIMKSSTTTRSNGDNNNNQQSSIFIKYEDEVKNDERLRRLINEYEDFIKNEDEDEGEEEEEEEERVISNSGNIFLTGSTGFVGSHILKNLRKRVSKKRTIIYCLVRKKSKHKIINSSSTPSDSTCEIIMIEGDLSKKWFGIEQVGSDEQFKEYFRTKKIGVIVHCGAYVNHFLSYDDLFEVNVQSTFDVLKLSKCFYLEHHQQQKRVQVHYVSTLSVFTTTSSSDIFHPQNIHLRKKGYGSSKYVSDCLFQKYVGNSNLFIHRLNLVGFSKQQQQQQQQENYKNRNEQDWLNIFFDLVVQETQKIPKLDHDDVPMDIHSVDFVSKSIVDPIFIPSNQEEKPKEINYSKKNCSMKEFMEYLIRYVRSRRKEKEAEEEEEGEELEEGRFEIITDFSEWIRNVTKHCFKKINDDEGSIINNRKYEKYMMFLEIWKKKGRIGDRSWVNMTGNVGECEDEKDEKYSYDDFVKMLETNYKTVF